jgi:hypothetical protein
MGLRGGVMMLYELGHVARQLGVSSRRIRALLAQGRIKGHKDERNMWMVQLPCFVSPGRRGPAPKCFLLDPVSGPAKPSKLGKTVQGVPQ